jgi:hypothetical protein
MICHDYELASALTYSQLAAGAIFVSFKIAEQLEAGFRAEGRVKELAHKLFLSEAVVMESAGKVLELAKSF